MKDMDFKIGHRPLRAFLACMLCAGAFSCTQETWQEDMSGESDMIFSAQVEKVATKLTGAGWSGGETIGISSGSDVKVYSVADVSGRLAAEGEPFRWRGQEYGLTAWYPCTESRIDLTDQTTEALHYGCDLLCSEATATSSREVTFFFTHQMTCAWWQLQSYDGYTAEDANNARVYFYGYGAVDYNNGQMTPAGETPGSLIEPYSLGNLTGQAMLVPCEMWDKPLIRVEIGGDTYVYTPTRENDTQNRNTGVLVANTRQQYFLNITRKQLSVTMTSDAVGWGSSDTVSDVTDSKFRVAVSAEVSGLQGYTAEGLDENGGINDAAAGFSITYSEKVPSGGIDCEGTCVRVRTVNAENGTVTFAFTDIRSDISLSRTEEYMETGYYLNNDGTFGSEYNSETAVGVVFHVGRHNTDDESLYDGKVGRIRGYAVALTDAVPTDGNAGFQWKSGAGDMTKAPDDPEYGVIDGNTTSYIGYANTYYLIDKVVEINDGTTVPAASAAVSYGGETAVEGTSGWYLPSRTQLVDISALAGKTIEGYTALSGTYWASSFDGNGTNAYRADFGSDGSIAGNDFWVASESRQKVRPVITF